MSNNLNQGASIEAAPCPFCGSEKLDIAIGMVERPSDYIMCNDETGCGAMISREDTKDGNLLAAWNSRTPAAATGDGELPPLPWGDDFEAWLEPRRQKDVAAAFHDYARAAIAADRAQRDAELIEWRRLRDPATLFVSLLRGEPARLPARELLNIAGYDQHVVDEALADRAQLAAKGQGKAVRQAWNAESGGWDDVNEREYAETRPEDRRTLYLAAPASAQPADPDLEARNNVARALGLGVIEDLVKFAEDAEEAGAQPDQRESALREAANIARCYDLGTPDGHAIADSIEVMLAVSPAAQPAKDGQIDPGQVQSISDRIRNTNWQGQDSANNGADEQKENANG